MRLFIDGHTGTGKTTVAQILCHRFSAEYVKSYSGSLGEITMQLFRAGNFDALRTFRSIVDDYCLNGLPARAVVDRLGPSSVSLLPSQMWPTELPMQSRTVILSASIETTCSRLATRGRDPWASKQHAWFIDVFQEIARRFGIPIISTDALSPNQVADRIVDLFEFE